MTLPVLMIAAIWIWHIEQERKTAANLPNAVVERPLTDEETVVPRKLFIDSLKSAQDLVGKPVWLQAGYQVEYFPYKAKHIDFAHQVGVLPGVQELDIKAVIEQATPPSFTTRLGRGSKNIFAIFTESGNPDEFAAPMGTVGGPFLEPGETKYYFDDLLFYDDPHQLYHFFPANVWKAIDAHQVIPGMSEIQTTMSLGQIQQSDSSDYGNRTVHFNYGQHNEKQASVTFEKNKATQIKAN
jgi:hypothetical protein